MVERLNADGWSGDVVADMWTRGGLEQESERCVGECDRGGWCCTVQLVQLCIADRTPPGIFASTDAVSSSTAFHEHAACRTRGLPEDQDRHLDCPERSSCTGGSLQMKGQDSCGGQPSLLAKAGFGATTWWRTLAGSKLEFLVENRVLDRIVFL